MRLSNSGSRLEPSVQPPPASTTQTPKASAGSSVAARRGTERQETSMLLGTGKGLDAQWHRPVI